MTALVWLPIVVGVVMLGIQVANPRFFWAMNKWKYRNPADNEPSDAYFEQQRVFAVIGIPVVIVMGVLFTAMIMDSEREAEQRQQQEEQERDEEGLWEDNDDPMSEYDY